MRSVIVLVVTAIGIHSAWAQTPAPAPKPAAQAPAPAPKPAPQAPAPKPATPAPATPAPKPAARPAAAPAARAGMAIAVTSPQGAALESVHVDVAGPTERSGDTNTNGQVNFTAMQAGTYRLRFSGDEVITFEKEVVLRAGQVARVEATIYPAPPPPPPPPAPKPEPVAPPAPSVGPAGEPRTLSIVNLLEQQMIPGNQARRDTLVSCSGNTRTTLVQLNQDQAERLYDTAEVTYYVVAGEGAVRVQGQDSALTAGGFASVPRGTGHSVIRRGRRPLILLTTVSGTPCEEAR